MKKIAITHFLRYALGALLVLVCTNTFANIHPRKEKIAHTYVSQYENVLGTSMEVKISTYSRSAAVETESMVLSEISRLSKILSAYDAQSEFSNWFKTSGRPVHVSPELFQVMALFDTWRARTNGALDASAEVVSRLWRQAASRQQLPTQEELRGAVAAVKQSHWVLNADAGTATHLDHEPLMLNSFVKSYIIKRSVDVARKRGGVRAIVLNIGGDMVISGSVNENVLITDPKADAENEIPLDALLLNNKAVATSGNYRRGELIAGQWYSHIVDPRTGLPADNIISATVVAPDATDAGALATAFNVMPVSESIQLAAGMPGIEYLIITKDGRRISSKGWNRLEVPLAAKKDEQKSDLKEQQVKAPWTNGFEMIINLEINKQKEGVAKRPYVAVWIEDSTHFPVRTVSVWHGSDRYMNELKSWYLKCRNNYNSDANFKSSITSATRSPGKYTLKWDGKDDKGNYVKPGKYIVKIEVSREHGTYQLMRQEIECNNTPQQINLAGNIEISSASLDYKVK